MASFSYSLEVRHDGLHKYRLITGKDRYVVQQKANAQLAQWDAAWERRQAQEAQRQARAQEAEAREAKKEEALQRTREAQEAIEQVKGLLAATLNVNDAVDWDTLKDKRPFPEPAPARVTDVEPIGPPNPDTAHYQPRFSFLDQLFPPLQRRKVEAAQATYARDLRRYELSRDAYREKVQAWEQAMRAWTQRRQRFCAGQAEKNAAIDADRQRYQEGNADAILDYCDMVLSRSSYPDWCPQQCRLEYLLETFTLVVDYQLPALEDLPTLQEVRYVQARDEFTEKPLKPAEANALYDEAIYQITLRTLHELFEADVIGALEAVVFNGWVQTIDPSTGQQVKPCIVSLQATKGEFEAINLAQIDPKACFKKLKGVSGARLSSLSPIAPIVQIDRSDERLVSAYQVVDHMEDGYNLASMPWEDFEHLVREVFERELSGAGGEVRVTRASRDGGVDAVAFDPDPIRGGKIIIQAKRYTNTVGVSAVRDLYGTVMNEGATKGILVTTSDYGLDAYGFAKDKPVTLLNGANLLHLLKKHGRKARIDLSEARQQA